MFLEGINCLDYGIPQNRKRLFIVGFHKLALLSYRRQYPGRSDGDSHIFEFPPKIRLKYTLSELLNKNLTQEIPRTIRGGGRGSPLGDRCHNWDGGYILSNSKMEYRLSIKDCLVLQNFPKNFQLCGCPTS